MPVFWRRQSASCKGKVLTRQTSCRARATLLILLSAFTLFNYPSSQSSLGDATQPDAATPPYYDTRCPETENTNQVRLMDWIKSWRQVILQLLLRQELRAGGGTRKEVKRRFNSSPINFETYFGYVIFFCYM